MFPSIRPPVAVAVTALLVSPPVLAQDSPSPGHRLVVPLDLTETWLVDNQGAIVHTWPNAYRAGAGAYLQDDGLLLRSIRSATSFGPGGIGGGLQRVAIDGTVVWDFRYESPDYVSHHDIEILPNGNVLVIAWEKKTRAEAIAAGRDPLITPPVLWSDRVVEVEPTGPTSGRVVWSWHAWDHLVQDHDQAMANWRGPTGVANHPELIDLNFPKRVPFAGDWLHLNSVDYDPIHDWIVLASPSVNEVWVIDHATTTAEAAGHTGGRWGKGGDLLYRWGNPQAYDAGDETDQQLLVVHGANIIPQGHPGAGNLILFNNQQPGGSAALELVLPLDPAGNFVRSGPAFGPAAPVWSLTGAFQSNFVSNVERLANGNTLVCSGQQGKVMEFEPGGEMVAAFSSGGEVVFHAHYVERSFWADSGTLSRTTGGRVGLELIAGSARAGLPYLVLGSASGTTPGTFLDTAGMTLPLNFDGYFLASLSSANVYPFLGTTGFLDARGKASAGIELPGGILPVQAVGMRFDHAYVLIDPVTLTLPLISGPVGFELVP